MAGCNQDGAVDSSDYRFNLAAKTLGTARAVLTDSSNHQLSIVVLEIAQALDEMAMALLHIG